ncbi:MAG: ferritin family protein [Candidatus Latescibacterota bacterium]
MEFANIEAILAFAIEKEQETAEFYVWASGLSDRANLRTMFLDLAGEERKHEAMLKGLDPRHLQTHLLAPVRDLKISDYLVDVAFSPDMDYQDALILATKREGRAQQFYLDLATHTDESALKNLFAVLAQEEARHKLRLETEYDENVLSDN